MGPDLKPRPVQLEQVAPGRYAAAFDTDEIGSYFIVVKPGAGRPTLRTGVNVSYSPELRDREPNLSLLSSIAALTPRGGEHGILTAALTAQAPLATDFFRHDLAKASGRRDLWPALVLAAVLLFVADVFIRRVAFEAKWLLLPITWAQTRLLRRRAPAATTPSMERLKVRKEEIAKQVNERRAAATRATTASQPKPPTKPSPAPRSAEPTKPQPERMPVAPPAAAEHSDASAAPAAAPPEDYTSRLLKAKRKVWTDRKDGDPPK